MSIDLVSDFDEDDPNEMFPLGKELDLDLNLYNQNTVEFSQDLENFRQILKPDELKIFALIQKKFDEFLRSELEKLRENHECELKILRDELETEKSTHTVDLSNLRTELELKHKQEMEKLRTYFEQKCSDMEKQYSEDVFSQHSRRHSNDTGSDISDQEIVLEEEKQRSSLPSTPKHKDKKNDLYSSPIHRKLTPTSLESKANKSPSKRSSLPKSPKMGPFGDVFDEMVIFFSLVLNR